MKARSIDSIALENILIAMESRTFGKDAAASIVGGEKLLERLISEGKVRANKPTNHQHGKWFCNAADVLRNCKRYIKG